MQVAINPAWLKTCGMKVKSPIGLCDGETLWPLFEVIKVDDFGSRGKMYKVQREFGDWVVWSIRGVIEMEDVVETEDGEQVAVMRLLGNFPL
ncbi:hypothetical protein EVB27_081 [Rhizobium phage RHph_TM16]|nr:hypothetical protein EVB27_081 [Rhizobium phage RHph_TM16]